MYDKILDHSSPQCKRACRWSKQGATLRHRVRRAGEVVKGEGMLFSIGCVKLARSSSSAIALLALSACATMPVGTSVAASDWPTVNGEPGGSRFSPLTEITPANVARLEPAWAYHMKPEGAPAIAPSGAERAQAQAEQGGGPGGGAGGPLSGFGPGGPFGAGGRFSPSETIPLVVDGVMYVGTPYARIVALNAATGQQLWVHDLPKGANPATRGMEYWPGDGMAPPSLIFGTSDGKLRSLRTSDGSPSPGFGENGVVDLRTPDVMVGGPNKPYQLSSPPIVYRNLVITGSQVGEAIGGSRGDVRAFDARTGKLAWTFRSIPEQNEPFGDSWANNSGHNRSGVNVWALMTLDTARGIVYLPFGAPTNDRVGVDRPGDNLFGSSIVAVDANSGRYLWHFQVVHHDIWDNDTEASPTLINVRRGGATIPAIAVTSKNSLLFILDRRSGKPIYDVVERPVPASDVPGERASPTQPFPVTPEPLSRMSFSANDVSTLTPEHEKFCRDLTGKLAFGGPFNPPAYNRPSLYFPGTLGGVNWAGGSFDPKLGLYVVNAFTLGQIQQIVPDGKGFFANRGPLNGRFWDPKTRLLCQSGSWGELVAVNVSTGRIVWRSPNGISENLPPGRQATGRPSIGGPITTAGGVTFIAATDDSRLRAYDTRTGKELWTYKLPASAHTNPITFSVGGRQYVAIVSTGGSFLGTPIESDQLTVFALPKG
jgi:quinoprotein glucose dehydrogenase